MQLTLATHNFIEKYNVLKKPTRQTHEFLRRHPTVYKIALLVNHLFRTAMMAAFLLYLPCTPWICLSVCLAGSIFYRLTVETNCAYKFALPSFAGGAAFLIAKAGWVNALAKGTLAAASCAFAAAIPLCAYFTYIALTVSYDVDK